MKNLILSTNKILDIHTINLNSKKLKNNIFKMHNKLLKSLIKEDINYAFSNFFRVSDWYPISLKDIYLFEKLINFNKKQKKLINIKLKKPSYLFYSLLIKNKMLLSRLSLKINFFDRLKFRLIFIYYFFLYIKKIIAFISKGFCFFICLTFLKNNTSTSKKIIFFSFTKFDQRDHYFGNMINNKKFYKINYDTNLKSLFINKNHIFRNLNFIDLLIIFFKFFIINISILSKYKSIPFKKNFLSNELNLFPFLRIHLLENFVCYNNLYDLMLFRSLDKFFSKNIIEKFIYPFECKPQDAIFLILKKNFKFKLIAFAHSFYNSGHLYTNYNDLYKNIDYLWVTGQIMYKFFQKKKWPKNIILNLGSPKIFTRYKNTLFKKSKNNKYKLLFIVGLPHDLIFYQNFLNKIKYYFIDHNHIEFRLNPLGDLRYQKNLFENIKSILPQSKVSNHKSLNHALNNSDISVFLNTSASVESLYSNSYSIYLDIDTDFHNDLFEFDNTINKFKVNNELEFVKKILTFNNLSKKVLYNDIEKQKSLAFEIFSPMAKDKINKLIYEI